VEFFLPAKVRKLKFIVKIKLFTFDRGAERKIAMFKIMKNALTFLLNDQALIKFTMRTKG
jgi:hypothetical protein